MKKIDVVAALIKNEQDEFLCCQRPDEGSLGGFWEFPGGKIERHESPEKALEREILEELDCRISIVSDLGINVHRYDFGEVSLHFFLCKLRSGSPTSLIHQKLKWLKKEEFSQLEWAPADIPVFERIG